MAVKRRRQPKPFCHRNDSVHQLSSCLQDAPDSQCDLCRAVAYQLSFVISLLRAADIALSGGVWSISRSSHVAWTCVQHLQASARLGVRVLSLLCQGWTWSPASSYHSIPPC